MKSVNIAIVGATGLVGRTFIKVLEERHFPVENIYFFASSRSAGEVLQFNNKSYIVELLNEQSFQREIDIALFSAGGEISKKYAPIAKSRGIIVIDNSSTWRMDERVPLVVPEVNPDDILWHQGIIANPNCSTIQSVVPLVELHRRYNITRIVYSTYQAVSGSGIGGIKDLENGMSGALPQTYPHPIAYNCIPHIDAFLESGYTKEEIKMIEETKKILGDSQIRITATTVRIPVVHGHSVSMNIEFNQPFDINDIKKILHYQDGVIVMDDIENNIYPMPITAKGTDQVYVGRIRRDYSIDNGLNMWVVADNIRKGAATNTVQIAELLLRRGLI